MFSVLFYLDFLFGHHSGVDHQGVKVHFLLFGLLLSRETSFEKHFFSFVQLFQQSNKFFLNLNLEFSNISEVLFVVDGLQALCYVLDKNLGDLNAQQYLCSHLDELSVALEN